ALHVHQQQIGDVIDAERLAFDHADERVSLELLVETRGAKLRRTRDVVAHPGAAGLLPVRPRVARLQGVGQLVAGRIGLPASVTRVTADEHRLAADDAGAVTDEPGHRADRPALA